jgi:hypothetical protein
MAERNTPNKKRMRNGGGMSKLSPKKIMLEKNRIAKATIPLVIPKSQDPRIIFQLLIGETNVYLRLLLQMSKRRT